MVHFIACYRTPTDPEALVAGAHGGGGKGFDPATFGL